MPECFRCGACCQYVVLPMGLLDCLEPDAERWLRLHLDAHPRGLLMRAPCRAWDHDRGCTIYDTRPEVCRTFEPDGTFCRDARRKDP